MGPRNALNEAMARAMFAVSGSRQRLQYAAFIALDIAIARPAQSHQLLF